MSSQGKLESIIGEQVIHLACDAAERNDGAALINALGCRSISANRPCSLHEPLLNSTKEAQMLHSRLFDQIQNSNNISMWTSSLLSSQSTSSQSAVQQQLKNSPVSTSQMLRALLMVPPVYKTPWSAAFQFVASLQSLGEGQRDQNNSHGFSRSSLRSSVSEIQSFLQQTVALWYERERRWNMSNTVSYNNHKNGSPRRLSTANSVDASSPNSINCVGTASDTPRDWILRLVKKLMEPLFIPNSQDDNQQHDKPRTLKNLKTNEDDFWMVPLELVATILSTMNNFDNSLQEEMLDCIFCLQEKHIRPDRILSWLSLATDLHTFLRTDDWKHLLLALHQKDIDTNQDTAFLVQQDLPCLMTAIVSLSSTLLLNSHTNNIGKERRSFMREIFHQWKRVALNVFHAASSDPNSFSTVTTVFQGGVSGLSSDILQEWVQRPQNNKDDSDNDDPPDWVKANMILAVMSEAQKSRSSMVDSFISRALDHAKGHCDVSLEGWNVLVSFACAAREQGPIQKRRGKSSKTSLVDAVERILHGTKYVGNGHFACGHAKGTDQLNAAGELVYQSLFLGGARDQPQKMPSSCLTRAHDWVTAANARFKSSLRVTSSHEVLVIAVAFIVIFCEVKKSRAFVVRGIVKCLGGETDCLTSKLDVALLHCLIVSTIVNNEIENPSDVAELRPIVDIMATGKLQKLVFFALVRAVAPTFRLAQDALISLARKRLHTPFGQQLWNTDHVDENSDRIQCCLYALVLLIASQEENASVAEAWKIISELIILNKPALPLGARAWLFNLIGELVKSERFPAEAELRFFRACLLRLLQFAGTAKTSNKPYICVRTVFKVWSAYDDCSIQSMPTEDIPGLYNLMCLLFLRTALSETLKNSNAAIQNGRMLLFQSCRPNIDVCSSVNVISDTNQGEQELVLCTFAIFLVAAAIELVVALKSDTSEESTSQMAPAWGLDINAMKHELVSQEMKTLMPLSQENLRPEWLEAVACSGQDNLASFDPPDDAVQDLALSLCNKVFLFLADDRWSFSGSRRRFPLSDVENRMFLLSLSTLSVCKKKLSSDNLMAQQIDSFDRSSVCAFLISAAVFIDSAISDRLSIFDTSCVLSLVLEQFDELERQLLDEKLLEEKDSPRDLSSILFGLFQFYECACSEEASVRLITYLTEFDAETETSASKPKPTHHHILLDIDSAIRRVRYGVLNVSRTCLQAVINGTGIALFTRSSSLEPINQSGDCGRSMSFRWTNKPTTRPIDFFMDCLEKFVNDLEAGMEGQSGGMSTNLYLAYMDSLHMLSKLLVVQVENVVESTELMAVLALCSESATRTQNVLFCYPPQKQSFFTTTFLFVAQSLPILSRRTTRRAMLSSEDSEIFDCSLCQHNSSSFAVASFELCSRKLKRWICSEMPTCMAWTMVNIPPAVDEQSIRLDDDSRDKKTRDGAMMSPAAGTGVPSFVTVPLQSTLGKNERGQLEGKLLLSTKEMWNWTCSSSLLAMETSWSEGYVTMHERPHFRHGKLDCPLSACDLVYISKRTSELSSVNSAARHAFADTGSEPNVQYLAVFFPSDAKIRLCGLVDRVIAALDLSMKIVDSLLRHKTIPSHDSFVEAISCIAVFGSMEQSDPFDCIANFRNWYAAEKKILCLSGESAQRAGEDLDIRSFPRVISRIEKLESTLIKLYNLLALDSKKQTAPQVSTDAVDVVDEILEKVVRRGSSESTRTPKMTLRKLVERRLTVLIKGRLRFDNGEQKVGSLYPRAKIGKRKRSGSHRRPIRSRNQTIDEWLRSDMQFDEKDVDGDPFLDLEDFIAEG